jgi:hypothetical protein
MFLYREILKKSLKITWDYKQLWFFGIFAALLSGVGRYSMSMSRMPEDWGGSVFSVLAITFDRSFRAGNVFSGIASFFQRDPASALIFIFFALIVAAVFLFIFWLAVVSQAGLINNAGKIIKGAGKRESAGIKEGFSAGVKNFWTVAAYNLIAAALTSFFAVLVGMPLVYLTAQSGFSVFLLYILLFLVFIPLALIISFLAKYAVCFTVLKGRGFVDSFAEACRLFGRNWIISIEMALILFVIDFLFVMVVGLVLMVLAIPYIFAAQVLSVGFFVAIGVAGFSQWAIMGGLLLALLAIIFAGAIITCFKTVAWTDIFTELVDKKGGLAKIVRLVESFKK